jgi:hypothetical protein
MEDEELKQLSEEIRREIFEVSLIGQKISYKEQDGIIVAFDFVNLIYLVEFKLNVPVGWTFLDLNTEKKYIKQYLTDAMKEIIECSTKKFFLLPEATILSINETTKKSSQS